MKEIKGIGFYIPSEYEDFIAVDSFSSLGDTDIAVFSPDLSTTNYSTSTGSVYMREVEHEGKPLYNKESSVLIKEHVEHWKKEFLNFLETGKTLFVILPQKKDFYIHTGTKDISGTGKNQKTTHHLSLFSNYMFLPFKAIEFHPATGKKVLPKTDLIRDLFHHFKEQINYEVYLKSEKELKSLFTTKNGDRILGTAIKVKEGNVVFLPNFNFDDSKYTKSDEGKDGSYWTDEAMKLGKILTSSLAAIDKSLNNEKIKTPKPNWVTEDDFNLKKSVEIIEHIKIIKEKIEKKNKELEELNKELEEQESLKDLLFETGKPLEMAVTKGLQILGYKAENYDDGELELDQIILSPEGNRYIGECEGKESKDIDVSKFRQLQDGLNADYEKESVSEKAFGLLLGNSQRLTPPTERTLDFTLKCKSGAKREKIGLIRTIDLFYVCKIIIENNDLEFAKKCREAIHTQLGEVIKFPDYK